MLLRLFRCFRVVAEEGSVIRAASAMGIAQPALSRSLHALETLVGSTLIDRGPRGVTLTATGVELLRSLRPLFAQVDETIRLVRLTGEGKAGTLRLGLTRAALDSRRIGRGLAALQERLPDVTVIVTEVDTPQQSEQLRTGGLDLGIGFAGFTHDAIRSVPLCDVQVDSAILPESHPLAAARSINTGQLSSERLLLVGPQGSTFNRNLLEALGRAGAENHEVVPTLASLFSLVAAGRGWTIAPGTDFSAPIGTVVVPLAGFAATLTMAATSRRNDESPLASSVSEFLCRAVNDDLDPLVDAGDREHRGSLSLDLRRLRSFVVAAEAGSISLASRRLGLTQSGLSRQLRSFERDLGVTLFRRRLQGIEPTPAGDLLRQDAARIQSLVDSALARVVAKFRGVTGRCTIGAMATEFTGNLVPAAIRLVATRFPAVSIEVDEMLSLAQVARLIDHRIDLGLAAANVRCAEDEPLDDLLVQDDPIEGALLGASSSLAGRAAVRPADLSDIPFCFIAREVNPAFYDTTMERLAALGVSPRLVGSYNGTRAMWRAATDLGGWALAARSLQARPFPGMVAVPIKGLHIPWGIRLLWRRDEYDPAVLAVRNVFRDLLTTRSGPSKRPKRHHQ